MSAGVVGPQLSWGPCPLSCCWGTWRGLGPCLDDPKDLRILWDKASAAAPKGVPGKNDKRN